MPGAVAAAAAAAAGFTAVAVALAFLSVALGAFFRDPERCSEAPANAVLSPADGRVVVVEHDAAGVHLAVFLSVFNVHVTRSPMAGRLRSWDHIKGGYSMAFRKSAAHNARHRVVIVAEHGDVELSLMAGAVARRIVPWVRPPAELGRGQRIALIKFGSRAELRLPAAYSAVVSVGDRVRAGETVIARANPTDEAPA